MSWDHVYGHCDGILRKNNKDTLAKDLEALGSSSFNSQQSPVCLVDAVSFVQKLASNHKTFAEIGKDIFHKIINEGIAYERIDILFEHTETFQSKTKRC